MENNFLELVKANNGFEICLGFINDEDHFIGGTGNTVWYLVSKGKSQELWQGELKDGVWTDRHTVVKKKIAVEEASESGTAIRMAEERLYFGQDKIAADGRKPVETEVHGLKCSHYVYGFGVTAYDIIDEYGVTGCYSFTDDISVGYRFRNVATGESVRVPKL